MLQDSATIESSFNRFVNRIIEKERVFYLSNEDGVANSVSNKNEEITILMFWSDQAYATRAKGIFNEFYEEQEMELFSFLYQWLPGMTGDGVLAGPNWDSNLFGKEIEAFELREFIESKMPSELLQKYTSKFEELTKEV